MDLIETFKRIQDVPRLLEILQKLAQHGFGTLAALVRAEVGPLYEVLQTLSFPTEPVSPQAGSATFAVRLRLLIQDLGPTVIKFGQILSTRPDLIPADIQQELNQLYDNVEPCPFPQVREQVERELGRPLEESFARFDEKPLGTASIGQVHPACLLSGEEVVVKVQRPNIEQRIKRDLEILGVLAEFIEKRVPEARSANLVGIVREFDRAIVKELDYRYERRNGAALMQICRAVPGIVVPRTFADRSSRRVLTMERIRGVKITQAAEVGSEGPRLAKLALQAIIVMVFEHGLFHADPHPGNLFALPDNRLALLDMGMVGRLSENMRFQLADLLFAMTGRDVDGVVDSLLQMGVRERKVVGADLARDVAEIMDKIIGVPLVEVSFAEVVADLFEASRAHGVRVPHELALLGKALMTVEGVGRALDPNIDLQAEVAPYVQKLLALKCAPDRLARIFMHRTRQWSRWSWELPERVMTTLDDLERGNLKVRVEQTDQLVLLRALDALVGKLAAGIITSALIVSSALVVIFTPSDVRVFGRPLRQYLGLIGYLAAAFFGVKVSRQVVKGPEERR